MKRFIFLFILFFCHTAWAQVTARINWYSKSTRGSGDSLFYDPARKLTWEDFQAPPDNRSIAAAVTSSGFGYEVSMRSTGERMVVEVTVNCFFNKNNSWVKPGMASGYALVHEQHHFDITYISTCLFIRKLRKAVFTRENYESLVEDLYNECYRDMENMQEAYDSGTSNGQLKNRQQEWNARVERQLFTLTKD